MSRPQCPNPTLNIELYTGSCAQRPSTSGAQTDWFSYWDTHAKKSRLESRVVCYSGSCNSSREHKSYKQVASTLGRDRTMYSAVHKCGLVSKTGNQPTTHLCALGFARLTPCDHRSWLHSHTLCARHSKSLIFGKLNSMTNMAAVWSVFAR